MDWARKVNPVSEHQFHNGMQFVRVVGHELPAMTNIFRRTIARPINLHGIAADQFLSAGPQIGVAQGRQFQVHGAISSATMLDVFLPPFVVAVADGKRH